MNKRGAAGFIAFGVVFILFLLFMLFRPDTNFITGFATYTYSYDDNPANTIYTGQIINSSVKFTLGVSPANNIYNNTEYKLGIYTGDDQKAISSVITADNIFNKTFRLEKKLDPTKEITEYLIQFRHEDLIKRRWDEYFSKKT